MTEGKGLRRRGEKKKKKQSEWPLGALAVGTLEPAADGRRQAHRHGAAHDRPGGGGGLVSKMRKWFGSKPKESEPGAQVASEKRSGHASKVPSPAWNPASPHHQPQQQHQQLAAVPPSAATSSRKASGSSPEGSEEDTQTSVRSSSGTAATLASGKIERRHSVDSRRSARNYALRDSTVVWDGRVTWFAVGRA